MARKYFQKIGNLLEIEVGGWRQENVHLETVNDQLYIYGEPCGEPGAGFAPLPATTDLDLLFGIVKLAKSDVGPASLEAYTESVMAEEALQWCKKNGLPDFKQSRDYAGVGYTGPEGDRISLEEFQRETAVLHTLFHLWRSMDLKDSEGVSKYTQALAMPSFLGYKLEDSNYEVKEYWGRSAFLDLISLRIKRISPRLSVPSGDPRSLPKIIFQAESLFTAAFFQLACLSAQGEVNEKNVILCPADRGGCGNLFFGHGNRKFCPLCDRRTAHSRRKAKQGRAEK